MFFDSIIGHEEVKKQLYNSVNIGNLSHAHIFCGEDGIGKSIFAKKLSVAIIGKEQDKQYADIIEWSIAKGKRSIGIREVISIIDEINKKPYECDRKVIIIHEADKMTDEAQNAFLKTIEEPPKGVFIMLLCESLEFILDTIKSRCQIHFFNKLDSNSMKKYLVRTYPELSDNDVDMLVSFSDGIPGRADRFLKDNEFMDMRNIVLEILECSVSNSKLDILKYEEFFLRNREIWREILACFIYYIRDILVYKETKNENMLINSDKISQIKILSDAFSFNKLNAMVNFINDSAENLNSNVNMSLAIDEMLLKMQEV